MLTPEWYEACTDQILVLYRQLEDDILKDIIRRMMKTGIVTESAKWQAKMLQESGLLYNDIMQKIAKYTSKTAEEVRLLFEEAGTEVMRNDNIIAQSATGHELRLSDSKLKILKANYRSTLGNLQNLTNTTAKTSQAAFIAACNNAHMQITSGAFSYQEAIRNAVRKFSDGVYVTYPSGHRDRLDVAIRRAALTGVGQTAAKISIMNAEEMDCDLMEITAHAGARPEHAKWQGKLVSRTGKNVGRIVDGVKVLSLTDIGYGTGAGFRGWNCRHDWYPYFEGYSTLNYTDEELAKLNEKNVEYDGQMYSQYDISQMQRAKERKVRALKRECILNQTTAENAQDADLKSTMQTDYQKSAVKLKAAEQDLKAFCKATGQDRDRFREQVLGFSRSKAQRAVQSNNTYFRKSMKEKGFENPPKSLAIFEKMQYNNPNEYELMKSYEKSVDNGMLSPLVGYEKYKEYHQRVETELIGLTTSNGVTVRSQSKHFLERVFGTISDPSHENHPRTGVELEMIVDALKNGSVRQHKNGSYVYKVSDCEVSLNPNTGNLIQVTPQ